MTTIQTTPSEHALSGAGNLNAQGEPDTAFKPTFVRVDKSEIDELCQYLEWLTRNPNPSDSTLQEETELTARLIGNAVLCTDDWARDVGADHVLLGERHDMTAHNLVQSLMALHRGKGLGLEMPSNFLSFSFDVWVRINTSQEVKASDYPFYQEALNKAGLKNDDILLDGNFTTYSPLSNQWIIHALKQNNLPVMFNDHPHDGSGYLIKEEKISNISITSRAGMQHRNQHMVDKMGALQQVGLSHVAGSIWHCPFRESMVSMVSQKGKKFVAPIFDKACFERDMPEEAKSLDSVRPHFLPGRSFNQAEESYSSAFERDYVQATLSHFGYSETQFNGFLDAQRQAAERVASTFEDVYQKHRPTAWRRLLKGLYPAWR